MAPLSDMNIESGDATTLVQDSPSPGVHENDILPTPPNETSSSIQSTSATSRLQKQRLQQYLKKIKRVVRDRTPMKKDGPITTLDALEETLNILNSVASTPKRNETTQLCIEGKPLSPAESSWSSESDQNINVIKNETSEDVSNTIRFKPNFSETTTTTSSSGCCNRLIATLFLELPQGTITEILPNNNTIETQQDNYQLCNILRRGDCFLDVLQGKGAQTMLLNAFCGHSKRRMYARIKCLKEIAPFELLCEFSSSGKGPTTCIARIQILRLETLFQPINSLAQHRAVFTTRHNASCAVIYLDSTSIPFLGHFPSEITGRSIFSFIHFDDVHRVKQTHVQLHSNGERIVSTPKLRMVAYNGNIVYTDSEWSAFVNPWTQQIEMIVGRHSVRADSLMPIEMFEASCPTMPSKLSESEMRLVDSELRALLAQPVRSVNEMKHNLEPVATVSSYIDKIVETLVNGSNDPNEVQQQQVLTSTRISPPTVDSPQSAASLSYNQINCLENVNRLLKSQTEVQTRMSRLITDSTGLIEEQIPLTKEVLQQHNKKWEEECKYTWKNRLALKRSADNITTVEPEAKFPRIDLTSRMQHVPLISDNTTTGQHNLINICVPKQTYDVYRQLPQATSVLQSEQSIYTTFWLDYLTAIQLQAQNYNQINF